MPFKITFRTALQKMSNSYRKSRRESMLMEPPFLALPISPHHDEAYYIIEDFSNMTMTSCDSDGEKTYYENETFYEVGPARTPLRRSTKRKHSSKSAMPSSPLKPLCTSTPHNFDIEEFNYSPPAKRAPILRRIPLKLDIPLQRPPAAPIKEEEEEEHSRAEPVSFRIKPDFISTLVRKATDN